jgi:hypothetical protein
LPEASRSTACRGTVDIADVEPKRTTAVEGCPRSSEQLQSRSDVISARFYRSECGHYYANYINTAAVNAGVARHQKEHLIVNLRPTSSGLKPDSLLAVSDVVVYGG